ALAHWAEMKGVWLWSGSAIIVVSLVIYVIALLVEWQFFNGIMSGGASAAFFFGLFMSLLVAMGNVRGAALRGLGFIVRGQLPEGLIRPFLFCVFIIIVAMLSRKLTPTSAMALHLVAAAVAFVVGAFLLVKVKPKEL